MSLSRVERCIKRDVFEQNTAAVLTPSPHYYSINHSPNRLNLSLHSHEDFWHRRGSCFGPAEPACRRQSYLESSCYSRKVQHRTGLSQSNRCTYTNRECLYGLVSRACEAEPMVYANIRQGLGPEPELLQDLYGDQGRWTL